MTNKFDGLDDAGHWFGDYFRENGSQWAQVCAYCGEVRVSSVTADGGVGQVVVDAQEECVRTGDTGPIGDVHYSPYRGRRPNFIVVNGVTTPAKPDLG